MPDSPAAPAASAATAAPAVPAPAPAEPTAPPAQATPAEPTEPIDYKAKYEEALTHSRKWETRAKENIDKAQKFDQAETAKLSEIEREQKRAAAAEKLAADSAAELLQLKLANEHGITKDERPLLTGTTEEALQAQVAAVLKLRAPSTASAAEAGITGGGSSTPTARAKTLQEAVAARVNKK